MVYLLNIRLGLRIEVMGSCIVVLAAALVVLDRNNVAPGIVFKFRLPYKSNRICWVSIGVRFGCHRGVELVTSNVFQCRDPNGFC